jgi:cellulose synthase/poly-beta-1,6-N-acetylglucosamine synthase-like glycosyltransferase
MNLFHWIAGTILAFAWLSRIIDATLGMPSLAEITRPEWDLTPSENQRITIIVPALNEEDDIEESLLSLLELDYANYEVIAVDDRSTDRTGQIMDRVSALPAAQGRLKVVHVEMLPQGWLGKPHAMWKASQQATGDWLLFTDADVIFRSDSVRRAVAYISSSSLPW